MSDDWNDLKKEGQIKQLNKLNVDDLSKKYGKPIEYFNSKKRLIEIIPIINPEAKPKRQAVPLKISPDKKIIDHRSGNISPEIAILEFLDNIFDNYQKNIAAINESLNIKLVFFSDEDEDGVIIEENSGGITINDIPNLLVIGKTSEPIPKKIGTWGEAFLHAVRSLGLSLEIYSYHLEGKPFYISINKEFFESDTPWETKPDIYDLGEMNIDRGTTTFVIKNLVPRLKKSSRIADFFKNLKSKIEITYWKRVDELQDKTRDALIQIEPFSTTPIKIEWKKIDFNRIFTYFPLCPPVHLVDYPIEIELKEAKDGNVEKMEKGEILVEAYCGLNPFIRDENSEYRNLNGVWMWGNDRLFVEQIYDKSYVGYGLINTGIPTFADKRAVVLLSIFIFFKTHNTKWNEFIPWGVPTKYGFNIESPIQEEIIKIITILAKRFVNAITIPGAREAIFKIFTHDFVELEDDEKIEYLKKNVDSFLYADIESMKEAPEEFLNEFSPFIRLNSDYFQKMKINNIDEIIADNEIFIKNAKDYEKSIKAAQGKEEYDGILPITFEIMGNAGFLPLISKAEAALDAAEEAIESAKEARERAELEELKKEKEKVRLETEAKEAEEEIKEAENLLKLKKEALLKAESEEISDLTLETQAAEQLKRKADEKVKKNIAQKEILEKEAKKAKEKKEIAKKEEEEAKKIKEKALKDLNNAEKVAEAPAGVKGDLLTIGAKSRELKKVVQQKRPTVKISFPLKKDNVETLRKEYNLRKNMKPTTIIKTIIEGIVEDVKNKEKNL